VLVPNIHTQYEAHTTRIRHSIPVLEKEKKIGSGTYEDTMCTQLRHLANTSTRLDIMGHGWCPNFQIFSDFDDQQGGERPLN
jgi:hypothetical protein